MAGGGSVPLPLAGSPPSPLGTVDTAQPQVGLVTFAAVFYSSLCPLTTTQRRTGLCEVIIHMFFFIYALITVSLNIRNRL